MESADVTRALQDQYSQRLQHVVSLLQNTAAELRSDDIIAAMRADPLTSPFAQQRAKEVYENALAEERENTIAQLMQESLNSKRIIASLEAKTREMDKKIDSLEEQYRFETEKTQELTREAELIHQKASLSSRNFEEMMHKKETETAAHLAKSQQEKMNLQGNFDKLELDLGRKSEELETVYQELAERNEEIRRLEQDLDSANESIRRQEERMQFYSKLSEEFQSADTVSQQRINALTGEIARLQRELHETQSQRDQSRQQLQEEVESHRQQQAKSERVHSETERALEQRLLQDLEAMREKAVTWRSRCQESESRLQDTQQSMDSMRMRWQQDMNRLRSEQELSVRQMETKLSETEKEYRNRQEEMKKEYDNREAELHKYYKELVLEKTQTDETERATEREQWKSTERALNDKINSILEDVQKNFIRLEDHEKVIEEKGDFYSQGVKKHTENLENDWNSRLKERIDSVKNQFQPEIEALNRKLKSIEEEKESLLLEKRKLSEELRLLDSELTRIKSIDREINSELAEHRKKFGEMYSQFEQKQRENSQLMAALEQAHDSEKEWERVKVSLERDNKRLQEKLREEELRFREEMREVVSGEREKLREMEGELQHLRLLHDQTCAELRSYQDICKGLELEVQTARSEVVQSDFPSPVIRSVSRDSVEKMAIRIDPGIRSKVTGSDVELMETKSNLDAIQATYRELKEKYNLLEDRLKGTEAAKNSLEMALNQSNRLLKDLKNRSDAKKNQTKILHFSKLFRRFKFSIQTEISKLQADIFQLVQEGKQTFNSLTSKGVVGVDGLISGLQREFHRKIREREEELEGLQGKYERLKTDMEGIGRVKEERWSRDLTKVNEEKTRLERELKTVLDERKSLAYQLEQLRIEHLNNLSSLRDMQEFIHKLQSEKTEIITNFTQETSKLQAENRAIKSISEQNMHSLQAKVVSLQSRSESDSVVKALERELMERERQLQTVQRTMKTQEGELRRVKMELEKVKESEELEMEVEDLVVQTGKSLERLRVPETRPMRRQPNPTPVHR